jgi:parallel beta-helix repeat protein
VQSVYLTSIYNNITFYYRLKGTGGWTGIGGATEQGDGSWLSSPWDTTTIGNGEYEIMLSCCYYDRDGGWRGENTLPVSYVIARLQVNSLIPSGPVTNPISYVDVVFSEDINALTFTIDDINMTGPNGSIAVNPPLYQGAKTWRISFLEQWVEGEYRIYIGPHIENADGNEMDQNGDGICGEYPEDYFVGSFAIAQNVALQFDGVDDYVITGDMSNLFANESETITLWFKANGPGVIVSELGQKAINGWQWHDSQIEVLPSGEVKVRVWNLASISVGTVSFGSWHHVALCYDKSTQRMQGFLDGVEAPTEVSGDRSAPWKSGYGLFYGFGATDGTNMGSGGYFNGIIDEVRVWNYARTPEEIISDMNHVLMGPKAGLVGYWRFDEGSGQIAHDSSGNGNDAQLGSTPSQDSADPNWVISTAPVTKGLGIFSHTPSGLVTHPVRYVDLTFSKMVEPETFTAEDVNIVGPQGVISVNSPSYQGGNVWRISFPEQSTEGEYHFSVGPHINEANDNGSQYTYLMEFATSWLLDANSSLFAKEFDFVADGKINFRDFAVFAENWSGFEAAISGNEMDQDANGIGGEDSDRYEGTFTISQNTTLNFDGVNDYAAVSNPSNLPTGDVLTITAWIKPSSQQADATYNGIVSYGPRYCTGTSIALSLQSNGLPSMATWCNDFVPSSGPVVSWDQWNFVGLVLNGSDVTLYVNGKPVRGTLNSKPNVQSGVLNIGCTDNVGRYFNGMIDEVCIWNYPLSQEEIVANMNHVLMGPQAGLVGHWQFEEGSGQIAHDSSGNGNDAQLGSTPGQDNANPTWVVSTVPLTKEFGIFGHTPSGLVTNPVSYVDFTFSKMVNPATFTVDDVNLIGPHGVISVNSPSYQGANIWRVSFPEQSADGEYRICIGPHIEDANGNEMDQDEDGIRGESPDDVYCGTFIIDRTGPRIIRHQESGDSGGVRKYVYVWFSEPIVPESFTLSEVEIDSGALTPIAITGFDENCYRISFDSASGTHQVLIGPDIRDKAGNMMDQNRNGINGEYPDDVYDASFTENQVEYGKLITVDDDGPADFNSIQEAIDYATDGDTVEVRPGVYLENIDFHGKSITVRAAFSNTDKESQYIELAEFADTWLLDVNSPLFSEGFDFVADGKIDFSDFAVFANKWDSFATAIIHSRGNDVVTFSSGEDANSVLSGFTIIGGGNGVYCNSSSPTIRDCVISNNSNIGLACYSSSPIVSGCTITNNSSYGILCWTSATPLIADCTISNNLSHGIYCESSLSPTIQGCNIAYNSGYGLLCNYSSPMVTNCVIAKNTSYGIECSSNSSPSIINCTIVNNIGRGISESLGQIKNCIIWNNTEDLFKSSATYSCIEAGDEGVGNNAYFPYFSDWAGGDYHLLSYSPCIDAGDPNSDYTKEPNGGGGRIDMGAYGNTGGATLASPDRDHDGLPDDWELLYWPADTNLSQGPMGDPDHDGLSNMVEYQLGWDPTMVDGLVSNTATGLYYPRIQLAIDLAHNGNTLIVYPGTYSENINFKGKKLVVRSDDPNNSSIVANTVVSGQGQTGVTFTSGEDGNSVLDGLTITGCHDGIYCTGSSPTIRDCVIRNNSNVGLYCYSSSSPLVVNCTITNNSGYGLMCQASSMPLVKDCTISHNSSYGIYFESSLSPMIKNCKIAYNSGYGVLCNYSSPMVTNCVIAKNSGYGIQCYSSPSFSITNCTIVGNVGRGISDCTGQITNCIFWNNSDDLYNCSATYSCIENGDNGTGNINVLPYFVDDANDDFHLMSWSACIDAGDPNSDYSNEPVPNGGRIDMGAYGNTKEATSGDKTDKDNDGLPDSWQRYHWSDYDPNVPNAKYGPNGNPDGDRFSNFIEYLFGYDPTAYTHWIAQIAYVRLSTPQIDPTKGEHLTTEYWLNMKPYQVVTSIIDSASQITVREIVQSANAGVNHFVWDGKDDGNAIVPSGFYDIRITAEFNGDTATWWSGGYPSYTYPSTYNVVVDSTNFDPYKNFPVKIDFDISDWGKLYLRVDCGSAPYLLMNYDKTLSPGHHTVYWNGRDGNGQIYEGPFNIYFGVPQGLVFGAVRVDYLAKQPEVSNLLCNQYRIIASYHEASTISYELDNDARVTIEIWDPDGNYFTTLLDKTVQTAGVNTVIWDGVDGYGNYISKEGVYSVKVKAEHPDYPELNFTIVGAITVYR